MITDFRVGRRGQVRATLPRHCHTATDSVIAKWAALAAAAAGAAASLPSAIITDRVSARLPECQSGITASTESVLGSESRRSDEWHYIMSGGGSRRLLAALPHCQWQ